MAAAATTRIDGGLADRAAIDALLGTAGTSDARLAEAAYQRFGTDGFLRLRGRFAIALFDSTGGAWVLARDPSGAVPLYFARTKNGELRHGTDARVLAREIGGAPDGDRLRAWAERGALVEEEESVFFGIEAVPPGWAVVIDPRGRAKKKAFWTFTPHVPPRQVAVEDAGREIEEALARALDRAGAGASSVTELFAGRQSAKAVGPGPKEEELTEAARLVDRPVPFTTLAEIGRALAGGGRVSDLGRREVFGGTVGALRAYVEGLAAFLAAEPSPRALADLFARGRHVEEALRDRTLYRALDAGVRIVARRWAKKLPPRMTEAVERRLDEPPPPASGGVPSYTGDVLTDRRFYEARDPSLIAAEAALTRAGVAVPYLDPEVVELAFSLPPACFIEGGRAMRVLAGGVPIEKPAPLPAAMVARAEATMRRFRSTAPASAEALDRWAGLSFFPGFTAS